ncbi:MAG: hypothetical protein CL455_07375 [Acidimicrobiaceae bacterium]|nr:hypothetical protein [Acidimicrobiaceae bacterium]
MEFWETTPPRLGCLAYPLAIVGGFVVMLLLAVAVSFSATNSILVGIGGAITASFIAWRNLRSDRVEKERENK